MKVAFVGLNSECAEWAVEHLSQIGVFSQHCSVQEILTGAVNIVQVTILVINIYPTSSCNVNTIRAIRNCI